jgi:hypothetical protein
VKLRRSGFPQPLQCPERRILYTDQTCRTPPRTFWAGPYPADVSSTFPVSEFVFFFRFSAAESWSSPSPIHPPSLFLRPSSHELWFFRVHLHRRRRKVLRRFFPRVCSSALLRPSSGSSGFISIDGGRRSVPFSSSPPTRTTGSD